MKNERLRVWFILWMVLGTGTALFLLSTIAEAGHEDRIKDKYAIIDCWEKKFIPIGEAKPDRNKVREGKKLTWHAYGPEHTKVKIVFGKDSNYPNCEGTSPDDDPDPKEDTIGSSEHEKMDLRVKTGKGGTHPDGKCYAYKIYCNSDMVEEESAPAALDPIIEVPKP
jgi:hypothetical protein